MAFFKGWLRLQYVNIIKKVFWWLFYAFVATLWFVKLGLIKMMRQHQPNISHSKNKILNHMKELSSETH